MTVGHGCLPKLVGEGSVENSWGPTEYLDYFTRKYDHALHMVFTRQKLRAGANP